MPTDYDDVIDFLLKFKPAGAPRWPYKGDLERQLKDAHVTLSLLRRLMARLQKEGIAYPDSPGGP